MIPNAYLVEWQARTPWKTMDMVEQDLLITRALVDIFSHESLRDHLAFRGGTALHKLFLETPRRYSEDIDLVQVKPGPIGPLFDGLREALRPWLGEPKRKIGPGVSTLTYRVAAEGVNQLLRLKVEINTREHFARLGLIRRAFVLDSRWHSGTCEVQTYAPAEILGTKMRALYQRRKGRDLFDLWLGLTMHLAEPPVIVDVFRFYLDHEGIRVTAAEYVSNLEGKLANPDFLGDLASLVPADLHYDPRAAAALVRETLLDEL